MSLQPPSIHNISSWQGAAIASTSRLLLPVNTMEYQIGSQSHSEQFEYSGADNLLSRLEQLVLAEMEHWSEPLQ